jgi:hypothetical protein
VSPNRQKQATIIVGGFLVFCFLTSSVYRHVAFVRESKKYIGSWKSWSFSGSDKLEIRSDMTYTFGNETHRWHLKDGMIVLEELHGEGENGDSQLTGDTQYITEGYFDGLSFARN